jgi:Leucine Rich Repeat.
MHLHALHEKWFLTSKYEITRVELTRNKLQRLPADFFKVLLHLEDLDVSSNSLVELPSDWLLLSKYERVIYMEFHFGRNEKYLQSRSLKLHEMNS